MIRISKSYRMSKSHLMCKIVLMAPLQAIPAVDSYQYRVLRQVILSNSAKKADVRYLESFVLFWMLKNLEKKKHRQILTLAWSKRCRQFGVVHFLERTGDKPATFIVGNFIQCGTMAFATSATVGKKKRYLLGESIPGTISAMLEPVLADQNFWCVRNFPAECFGTDEWLFLLYAALQTNQKKLKIDQTSICEVQLNTGSKEKMLKRWSMHSLT